MQSNGCYAKFEIDSAVDRWQSFRSPYFPGLLPMQHHSPNSSVKFRKEIWQQTKMIKKWKRDCEFRERIKTKKTSTKFSQSSAVFPRPPRVAPQHFHWSSADLHTARDSKCVQSVLDFQEASCKIKKPTKKVIVKVPSYSEVIVIVIAAVFPGSKHRFFNPNRYPCGRCWIRHFHHTSHGFGSWSATVSWHSQWYQLCLSWWWNHHLRGRITSSGWINHQLVNE